MVTVETTTAVVEQRLVEGELSCPGCGGVLARWGWGRARRLRGRAGLVEVRPRRARCRSCEATHILLPVLSLVRRADVVEVVGAGLELAAAGWGCRRIAERLGRPVTTVRGWLRCWSKRVGRAAAVFTAWLVALADDPAAVLPAPAGSPFRDAVCAVAGFAFAARARLGMLKVPTWLLVSAACHGRLLAPGRPSA
ncbi:helix-turn-helix domain-containing protein [Streptomyces malaysiensis]|uniref:Helix-turn-helix domain-containing protein n=1 Tax=Streptomyces malaysiensis subsp. samsunensis TaxID=459658 RepID=A0A9X2M4N6_STRMQ|nr:helix-turn-helix domain-containing protein [Streptomyces samsunensis]MCQ8835217.1 helix-turn-helix domain-containing protein [Streptomyces samsunensis]